MSSPLAELQSPPIENFLATVLSRTQTRAECKQPIDASVHF